VFDFINSFNHDVENRQSQLYNSDLPSDSLNYVLDYLNAKPYTTYGNAFKVTGYTHVNIGKITIFHRLYNITSKSYQKDWLESIKTLELTEEDENSPTSGCIIFFRVPADKEKYWAEKFKKYDLVEWTELNYIGEFYIN